MATPDEHPYNVKALCRLTGLNEHTLRAWERRYGAIAPSRKENQHRRYSHADVERLRRLVGLVNQDYAIGQIAALTDEALRELVAKHELIARSNEAERPVLVDAPAAGRSYQSVLAALRRFDLEGLQQELESARLRFGARDLALGVILPLMTEVGRLVVGGELDIGHEHALTAFVRAQLLDIFFCLRRINSSAHQSAGPKRIPRVVVATPEGDLHEIGILVGAILCSEAGLCVAYMGPNMPPSALARVASTLHADALLVGTSPLLPGVLPRSMAAFTDILCADVPASCQVWIGGCGAAATASGHGKRGRVRSLPLFSDLETAIGELRELS